MSTTNQVKVTFKNETKKFKKPADFESLLNLTVRAFGSTLPPQFKFYYVDAEGDLISISCQEDLEEALDSMPALRLIVEESIEAARFNLEPDFTMRSSMNMPLQMSPAIMNNQNFAGQEKQERRVSQAFEDVFDEEVKSMPSMSVASIHIEERRPTSEQAIDASNPTKFENFSQNTNIQTDEKELNATVNT